MTPMFGRSDAANSGKTHKHGAADVKLNLASGSDTNPHDVREKQYA